MSFDPVPVGEATAPRALVVGEHLPGSVAASLAASGLEIERAATTSAAHALIDRQVYRLVVLLDPLPMYHRLLEAMRSPGCPSRGAGVIVATDDDDLGPSLAGLAAPPNRVVPLERLDEQLPAEVSSLLNVAPRSPMRAWARLAGRTPTGVAHALCRTLNLSTTGMLLRGTTLPVGTELQFELRRSVRGPAVGGRARVVRHGRPGLEPTGAMALTFLQLTDGGDRLLERFVERATSAVLGETIPPGTVAGTRRAPMHQLDELEHELLPGLLTRLRSPDWYLTGVELGLESLRDFQQISELVFRGDAARAEVKQHLAHLEKVHAHLTDFANPGRAVEQRVMIMVEARPILEHMVDDLACRDDSTTASAAGRSVGVDRVTARIVRTVANLESLRRLREASDELLAPALSVLRWRRRHVTARYFGEYRALLRVLGVASEADIASAAAVRHLQARADTEIRSLEERLRRIHRRIYTGRHAVASTGDLLGDLAEAKVAPLLQEIVSAGRGYLERAFSVYRHAIELRTVDRTQPPRAAYSR